MERLRLIVQNARKKTELKLSGILEDYLTKASDILKEYLDKDDKMNLFYNEYYAVEIEDINFDEGTVQLSGQVWSAREADDLETNVLHDTDGCFFRGEVFKSAYDANNSTLKAFIQMLYDAGCEYVLYYSDNPDIPAKLFPFFRVK